MSDYGKLKNAELEALLKERGLPHTGKKAEMVARLQEDDTKKNSAPNEDEIDWDDETAAPAPAAPEPATTTAAAPAPAPDAEPPSATTEEQPNAATETAEPAAEPQEEAKEPVNFSVGLASTTLDEELEKRKARAKRFGLPEDDEATKALERAKKFGETAGPKGLNEALPERTDKRRREGRDDGGRRDFKRGRGGRGGRRFDGRGDGRSGGRDRRGPGSTAPSNGSGNGSWMGEKDRLAAEERKKKWNTNS